MGSSMRPALARIVPAGLRWRLVAWVAGCRKAHFSSYLAADVAGTGSSVKIEDWVAPAL